MHRREPCHCDECKSANTKYIDGYRKDGPSVRGRYNQTGIAAESAGSGKTTKSKVSTFNEER
jgi:hypothetical protein